MSSHFDHAGIERLLEYCLSVEILTRGFDPVTVINAVLISISDPKALITRSFTEYVPDDG